MSWADPQWLEGTGASKWPHWIMSCESVGAISNRIVIIINSILVLGSLDVPRRVRLSAFKRSYDGVAGAMPQE